MSKAKIRYTGYRAWFENYLEESEEDIFITSFESVTIKSDDSSINGIDIFFKDTHGKKRKTFLKHNPYFYLLLDDSIDSYKKTAPIVNVVQEIDKTCIVDIQYVKKFDAEDLTFLREKPFLKITVNHPGVVPRLRDKCAECDPNILGWREADVLFHNRCAIDRDIRIGFWYRAHMNQGRIQSIRRLPEKIPPDLKILAIDLESEFHPERDPNYVLDPVLIVSMFTGIDNFIIIQQKDVDTTNIRDFYIIVRPPDKEHKKPWVDWVCKEDPIETDYLDRRLVHVIKTKNQEELINKTFEIIDYVRPDILADFYGDKYDLPVLIEKLSQYDQSFEEITGFLVRKFPNKTGNLFKDVDYVGSAGVIHLDAWLFNDKYSYLPKKELGLKASVEKKLKIIPIGREALKELKTNPAEAVGYAGCDGYITWRYVKEIVLEFYLSIGQMFAVNADEILTKKAGFLDDLLVDARGYLNNIVSRNRRFDATRREEIKNLTPNIIVKSLACTGASVEAKNIGIFRSDLRYNIDIDHEYIDNELLPMMNDIITKKIDLYNNMDWKLLNDPIKGIKEAFNLIKTQNGKNIQLMGGHVDVASMYPSVIRQFKLQPSGVVSPFKCMTCKNRELKNKCWLDFDWIIKIEAQRPCASFPCEEDCPDKCSYYKPENVGNIKRSREVFALEDSKVVAYQVRDKTFVKVPIKTTYFSIGVEEDPYIAIRKWIKTFKSDIDVSDKLEKGFFDYFDGVEDISLPDRSFMAVDVRLKNITMYVSIKTRICQKAYGHVSEIMEDFFQMRIKHKREAQRLADIIKIGAEKITPGMIQAQKFHDSTQQGMKVPLNSVYGLFGVKRGVRNSSLPCAGITTIESAEIIIAAANEIDHMGIVTEFDTDGIYCFLPKIFPQIVSLIFKDNNGNKQIISLRMIAELLNQKARKYFRNDNYWVNDGEKIYNSPKSLIVFEQDGPYDFQFVMGKKKYIVYNYKNDNWVEEELTGLETKRSDFTELQKIFQEKIIKAYLSKFNSEELMTVRDLYQLADRYAKSIKKKLLKGKIPIKYLIKPKAVNKELKSYNQNLPQVRAAKILKEIGFDVIPGTRIDMVKLKGDLIVPYQLFTIRNKKKFKKILTKFNYYPLEVMMGLIQTPKDLKRFIDYDQYVEDIFGDGKIYDRMIGKFLE